MAEPELHIFYWTKDGLWHPCLRWKDRYDPQYSPCNEDFMGPGYSDPFSVRTMLRRLFPTISNVKVGRKQGPPEEGDEGYE